MTSDVQENLEKSEKYTNKKFKTFFSKFSLPNILMYGTMSHEVSKNKRGEKLLSSYVKVNSKNAFYIF
jgi:hypothetical protein